MHMCMYMYMYMYMCMHVDMYKFVNGNRSMTPISRFIVSSVSMHAAICTCICVFSCTTAHWSRYQLSLILFPTPSWGLLITCARGKWILLCLCICICICVCICTCICICICMWICICKFAGGNRSMPPISRFTVSSVSMHAAIPTCTYIFELPNTTM